MKYKRLGNSGLKVSEICLGAMTFGKEWGWGSTYGESKKVFDTFANAGGNFIDSADFYTNGTSEKYLGEFVGSERERFVIATKYTLNTHPEDPNAGGNHRKNLVQSLDASLKRLNMDYIDVYWVHAWDAMTPVEEMMRALDDQVKLGKILYIGISDAPAWVVARANTIAEQRGWTPFTALQTQYSLVERTSERELLPMTNALDIGVTAWSPLAGGILTGKYNMDTDEEKRYTPENPWTAPNLTERNLEIAKTVINTAKELDQTPAQVAINWIRQKNPSNKIIPIVGARSEKHIKDNLQCLDFEIPAELMEKLDNVSQISLGFPHEFLNIEHVRQLIHGTAGMM